ncbi:MAG TPA: STAS domain-containing protein [Dongiaceae bacterium]|nr:STAS domain-containing protein [Dongiaceae bacterium]
MKIATRQVGDATILDLTGDITLFNTPEIRKSMLALLKEQRAAQLIVNMTAVPYIDSSGIAALVEGLKVSRDLKSRFALFGLSKSAKTVLELTHLIRVFEVHPTEQDALERPASGTASAGAGGGEKP